MKINCGSRIREYRKKCGISQQDLADRIGVKNQTISSWELNRTEPKMGQIEKMAMIFGCNKSDIMGNDSDVPVYDPSMQEVIALYSKLNSEQKASVLSMLRTFVV